MKKRTALAALLCAAVLLPLLLSSCVAGDVLDFLAALSSLAAAESGAEVPPEDTAQGVKDHTHKFTKLSRTPPSCVEDGLAVYVCACGEDSLEVLPCSGHLWEPDSETPPGCLTEGIRTYECQRCGETRTEPGSPKTGHRFVFSGTVDPTYGAGGYDLYVCAGCGAEERRNAVPALVHTEASYTDRCSMVDYTAAAMPGETPWAALNQLLPGALTTEGVRTDCAPYTRDQIYLKLKEGHNFLPRNCVFGSTGSRMNLYCTSEQDLAVMKSDLAWIASSVRSLGIDRNTTQREAIELINVFLCKKMRYDYSANGNSDVHRAISSSTGICQVYGQMFQLMCQYCGIETYYVEDVAHDHVYNYTVFSDGTKLYTDVTWNDAAKNRVEVENAGYSEAQIALFRSRYLLKPYGEFMTLHKWQ